MSLHGKACLWGALYVALVVAPLAALLVAPTPAKGGFWWDVAIGLGFAGLTMMSIQFLLTARARPAVAPFGIDVIYYFHRYVGYVLLAVVLAHPALLLATDPALASRWNPATASWPMLSGMGAVALLIVLVASSAWRKRLRIPYGVWRPLHLTLAAGAVLLGFAHMRAIGYYSATPGVSGLWTAIGLSVAAVVLWVRLVRPLVLLARPYVVTEVRPEQGDSWTLTLAPEGHAGWTFQPGQFAWVTLGQSPFTMQEHPFTIASAPDTGRLEITIKALGDFTRTVGDIPPGTRATVDGPYGAFSMDRHPGAHGYVFIAGGIGVTPMLSMLQALDARGDTRRHLLFAAHGRWDRVPRRDEIERLSGRLHLTVVQTLEEPHAAWTGERGRLTRDMLDRHLPRERREYEYFLCGPQPMTHAVERWLHELGIPMSRVHTELFDMA